MILKSMEKDELKIFVHDSRESMGRQVAKDFAGYVRKALAEKESINVIFAAAPSQNDFLESLEKEKGVEWNRVNAFHMDEYVGIGIEDEQSFARFVKEKVVDSLGIKNFFAINGKADDIEEDCERYTALLRKYKVDAVCLGIGENGHIAFNDPGEADFWDDKDVKKVKLDEVCRNQQVNDKCFPDIDSVPKYAITLTVPTLLRAKAMFCTVPAPTKADAVNKMVNGSVSENLPATALRIHKNATLYCDKDSGKYIL